MELEPNENLYELAHRLREHVPLELIRTCHIYISPQEYRFVADTELFFRQRADYAITDYFRKEHFNYPCIVFPPRFDIQRSTGEMEMNVDFVILSPDVELSNVFHVNETPGGWTNVERNKQRADLLQSIEDTYKILEKNRLQSK